jgi:hypothetical protein
MGRKFQHFKEPSLSSFPILSTCSRKKSYARRLGILGIVQKARRKNTMHNSPDHLQTSHTCYSSHVRNHNFRPSRILQKTCVEAPPILSTQVSTGRDIRTWTPPFLEDVKRFESWKHARALHIPALKQKHVPWLCELLEITRTIIDQGLSLMSDSEFSKPPGHERVSCFFWKKGGQRASRRTYTILDAFSVPKALIKLLEISQTCILLPFFWKKGRQRTAHRTCIIVPRDFVPRK